MSPALRPGTNIVIRDTPAAAGAPTDTGVWFAVGEAERGPLEPIQVTSLAEFVEKLGDRMSFSVLYDALDVFFREGGGRAYCSRVVGPAATTGLLNLSDGAATCLTVTALGPGAWSANITIAVEAGGTAGTFVIVVRYKGVIVERSGDLENTAAAVGWGSTSKYIRIAQGGSVVDPVVLAATALSAGTDDRASITETHWLTALDRLTKGYGPGQVSMPGRVTSTARTNLLAHAVANNRVALLDSTDTPTVATLKTDVTAARGINDRFGGIFWPWLVVPGLVPNTTRPAPPCALIAGLIGRNDVVLSSNDPSAGDRGISQFAIELSQLGVTDTIRDELNTAGVNVIRRMHGTIRNYGWRTLSDPYTKPNWINLGNSRTFMDVAAKSDVVAERFVLEKIDGQGILLSQFGGELRAMLVPFWEEQALYGMTPDEAFFVDTGPTINTPATIAAGEIKAVISLRMSPFGELVTVEIVKVAVTERVI